ncbi:MAG: TolC family protein [Alphaproteobacteria bacterium]
MISQILPRGAGRQAWRSCALAMGLLLLGACAQLSPDGGFDDVRLRAGRALDKDVAAIRTEADAQAARDRVRQLLGKTLSPDDAVQIALLNNRGLQAAYNELFIAEATKVEASLPPNPTFSIMRMVSRPEVEFERQIAINILALATLPTRTAIAEDRFRQAQLRAAEATLRVALETRRAYYRAVAAQQTVSGLVQAQSAAAAAAILARRLGQTGALNKLDQAREQVFYAEIAGQLAIARQRAQREREKLIRLLGVWGADTAFKISPALPTLPRQPRQLPDIEREALGNRIDLLTARIELDALAKSFGLAQATRFIDGLEASGRIDSIRETPGDRFTRTGVEIAFTIPIYDFGAVRTRQAEQIYLQAVNRLAAKAVDVRSEAREAYRAYRAAHEIARHYRFEVLALRKIISDEMLLRYNAMSIDVFELLTEARQRLAANMTAIDAQRDFWLADTDLTAATLGGELETGDADQPKSSAAPAKADH